VQSDDKACEKFLAERHDHATADARAAQHIARQVISESAVYIDRDCDLGEHRASLYTNFSASENQGRALT
jgi:hypothetical protein